MHDHQDKVFGRPSHIGRGDIDLHDLERIFSFKLAFSLL
jgi:hypothetical protein